MEPQTKSFVKNLKIAEQVKLLDYSYKSQKFLSVEFWFELCENSHHANGKKRGNIKFL
jgi:hypothetical protein